MFWTHLPEFIKKRIIFSNIPDLTKPPKNIEFSIASSYDDYDECFRLLHDVYVDANFIEASYPPVRIVEQHNDPQTAIFNGKCDGKIIYTSSLFPDNEFGLPIDIGFKKEVDALRNQGKKLAEIGCLATHHDYRNGNKVIPMYGNRMLIQYAKYTLGIDDILITTHPKYLKIYVDMFQFNVIGEISSFGYVNDNPAVALRLDLNNIEKIEKFYKPAKLNKNVYEFIFGKTLNPGLHD